jgi:hypothetical protein
LVRIVALILSELWLGSCQGRRTPDHGQPLATVGGRIIGEADFQHHLAQAVPAERRAAIARDPSERRLALQEFLDDTAVLEKARQVGIPRDAAFVKAVALLEMKTLAHLMTDRGRELILQHSQVTAAEVEARYHAHKNELLVEPRFSLRQILVYVEGNAAFPERGLSDVKAKAKAAKALAALARGTSWAAAVKTFSDEPGNDGKGLIRDGRFGYFAKEVEAAIRTQPIGRPGKPFRSLFGYHVIEVVDRILEGQPKPFDEVKRMLEGQLRDEHGARARAIFMAPIEAEIGLHITPVGKSEASLLDPTAVPADAILAAVGNRQVSESDFQWFLKDAWLPSQRRAAFARPGARQGMLRSFLDMLVLEAKARKDGVAHSQVFLRERSVMEERLLAEFMRERDKMGVLCDCGNTEEERRASLRAYFDRTRGEVGLVMVAS